MELSLPGSFEALMAMSLFAYLFKVAVILAAFYLLYRLLMRNETLHRMNRTLLVGMLVLSFLLPFCHLTIHREASADMTAVQTYAGNEIAAVEQPAMQTASNVQVAENNADSGIQDMSVAAGQNVLTAKAPDNGVHSWTDVNRLRRNNVICLVLFSIWLAGFLFHLSRTILSICNVRRIIRYGRNVSNDNVIRIVVSDRVATPFSWMNTIVLPKADYDSDNCQVILEHETAHVRFRHSWDMLVVDLLSSVQWFNPVTFYLRRDLQNVHEFQADNRVLERGFEPKGYQFMLLGKMASMSGYSVANHFKKINLSNRITMMNRKKSAKSRGLKALYAPLLVAIVLSVFAVTVYDCKPDNNPAGNTVMGDFAFRKATRNLFGDSIAALDAKYGQGKFNVKPYGTANLTILPDRTAKVSMGFGDEGKIMELAGIPSYLVGLTDGMPVYRCVILLSEMGEEDLTANGLPAIRPLLEELESNGIRSIVVATEEESREVYFSTYKYGRIYALDDGSYALDHNGLEVHGSFSDIVEWVTLLDVEYVAFYPNQEMPWSHAQTIMDISMERGMRTFSICRIRDNGVSLKSILDEIKGIKAIMEGNGTKSLKSKGNGSYDMVVLPTKPASTARFTGKTVMEVAEMLEKDNRDSFRNKAIKWLDSPKSYDNEFRSISAVAFCEDELIITYSMGFSRNNWYKPIQGVAVKADGKLYKLLHDGGNPEFEDYPWVQEDSYANGSFNWVPEDGVIYGALHFEPVPVDVTEFDIVSADDPNDYKLLGLEVSGPDKRFVGFRKMYASGQTTADLGAYEPSAITAYRMDVSSGECRLKIGVLVRSDFSFKMNFGSDLTLTTHDGRKLKLLRSEDVPIDEDFERIGGDWVETGATLVFPGFDIDSSQADGSAFMMTLSGSICHKYVELPFNVFNLQ